jgi:hypothetical protein
MSVRGGRTIRGMRMRERKRKRMSIERETIHSERWDGEKCNPCLLGVFQEERIQRAFGAVENSDAIMVLIGLVQ